MTKDVEVLYSGNGVLLREIKEDLSKWREPWVRRLNIVKMSVLP